MCINDALDCKEFDAKKKVLNLKKISVAQRKTLKMITSSLAEIYTTSQFGSQFGFLS